VEHEHDVERIPGDQRFRRGQRLRSPLDFARVRRHGRHTGGALLALTCARRPEGARLPTRAGFSVGKRVGGAVQRNLVKRRLREALRRHLAQLPAGWDLVFSARPAALGADYAALAAEVTALLARAGLLPAETTSDPGSPDHRGAS
jgi:ribonuclease P protein component